MWDSFAILRRHRLCAAFGVGGYAAGPMMLAAVLRGMPTVVFEPNAEPGFTNRVLARMVDAHRHGLRSADRTLGTQSDAHRHSGAPGIFRDSRARAGRAVPYPDHRRQPGRAGHQSRGGGCRRLAGRAKKSLFIVHQTGERDYNAVRVAYARREFNAEVLPFIGNMAERFAQADLIVCRAGAITVAEVAAAGRAAIFIPFGASTDSHQLRNAQEMQSAGAARLIPEPQLTAERLTKEIFRLLDQPAEIAGDGGECAPPGEAARRRRISWI